MARTERGPRHPFPLPAALRISTGGDRDDPLILPFASRAAPPRRICILGDAAGTMARAYGHFFPSTRIDAVEIDGALTEIGRRFFDLHAPHLKTITADARVFIRQPGPRYDVIIVDAYRQPYIPFYLTTREFFAEVRSQTHSRWRRAGECRPSPRRDRARKGAGSHHAHRFRIRPAGPGRLFQHLALGKRRPAPHQRDLPCRATDPRPSGSARHSRRRSDRPRLTRRQRLHRQPSPG